MKRILPIITLFIIAGLNAWSQDNGDLDPTFANAGINITDVDFLDTFHDVFIQDDQKIIAAGMSFNASYVSTAHVVRYLSDGTIDTSFGTDGFFTYNLDFEANIYRVISKSNGDIVVCGSTTDYTNYNTLLIQLKADGTLDTNFGENGVVIQNLSLAPQFYESFGYGLSIDADENIFVAGSRLNTDYISEASIAKFSSSGELDTSFGTDGVAAVPAGDGSSQFENVIALDNGKIVATGSFGENILWYTMLVARFNEDGSPDATFGTDGVLKLDIGSVDDEGFDMTMTAEGDILIAGFGATQEYSYASLLVKISDDGTLDSSFGTDGVVTDNSENFVTGNDVEVMDDGKIIVSGTRGEGPPNSFHLTCWKYNADGSPDLDFGTNGSITHEIENYYTMGEGAAIQTDGKIVIAGRAMSTITNQNDFFVARLENSGTDGVIEQKSNTPGIYPNPAIANGSITLSLDQALSANASVEIFNNMGSRVASIPLNGSTQKQQNIKLPSEISAGLYLLRVNNNGLSTEAARLLISK